MRDCLSCIVTEMQPTSLSCSVESVWAVNPTPGGEDIWAVAWWIFTVWFLCAVRARVMPHHAVFFHLFIVSFPSPSPLNCFCETVNFFCQIILDVIFLCCSTLSSTSAPFWSLKTIQHQSEERTTFTWRKLPLLCGKTCLLVVNLSVCCLRGFVASHDAMTLVLLAAYLPIVFFSFNEKN